MRISDWSSDVCSSDLNTWLTAGGDVCSARQPEREASRYQRHHQIARGNPFRDQWFHVSTAQHSFNVPGMALTHLRIAQNQRIAQQLVQGDALVDQQRMPGGHRHHERSEEHTSELQSLMRISYAVFCLKKKKKQYQN